MGKYSFEDFPLEHDNRTLIHEGIYGYKVEISLFNPNMPKVFMDIALGMLNGYMDNVSKNTSGNDIELVDGSVEAYLEKDMEPDKKYAVCLYVWTKDESTMQDYTGRYQIKPNDRIFHCFREYIMAELKDMVFGRL